MQFFGMSPGLCVPFLYSPTADNNLSRIGGPLPRGVTPAFRTLPQKYFATLVFEDGVALSVFYAFDIFGQDDELDVIGFNNRLLFPSDLIHVVVHRNDEPSDTTIPTEVSNHDLLLQSSIDESIRGTTGESGPYAFSKIGGQPHMANVARVGHAFQLATDLGFHQVAQFHFPLKWIGDAEVTGFPWDPGSLHLLARGTGYRTLEFAFVVQQ